jgi:adenosine/AMP kinase
MTTRYEDLPHVGICTSSPGQRIGRTFDIADPKEILRYCGTPRVRDDTRRTALRIPAVTVRVVLCSLLVSLPFISDETNRHTPP